MPSLWLALHNAASGAPVAALILIGFTTISVLALSAAPQLRKRTLLRPHRIAQGRDYHTLISSGFIHADYTHLLLNALTFWSFGFALERTIGSPRFAALYFIGLLASSAGTVLRHRSDPGYASLGASGAILAVLFASIVYFPQQSLLILPLPLPIPAPLFAVCYLIYTIYAGRRGTGNINHEAHLDGAITGVLFVAVTEPEALRSALRMLF